MIARDNITVTDTTVSVIEALGGKVGIPDLYRHGGCWKSNRITYERSAEI